MRHFMQQHVHERPDHGIFERDLVRQRDLRRDLVQPGDVFVADRHRAAAVVGVHHAAVFDLDRQRLRQLERRQEFPKVLEHTALLQPLVDRLMHRVFGSP